MISGLLALAFLNLMPAVIRKQIKGIGLALNIT